MRLLIVADDFTGALDTGAQFAGYAVTCLVTGSLKPSPADVVVVDTASRHLTPDAAYRTVYAVVQKARRMGFTHYYKKVDSVLRGNLGCELRAFMQVLSCSELPFVPAWPENGRTTRDGIQYVGGIPLADSIFGKDPFDPVRHSRIRDIIAEQADPDGIRIFDAETREDMAAIAATHDLRVSAGCAGLARHLPGIMGFRPRPGPVALPAQEYFIVSASIHPLTIRQLASARQAGFPVVALSGQHKTGLVPFRTPPFQNRLIIASSLDQGEAIDLQDAAMRIRITDILAAASAEYLHSGKLAFIIGGDLMQAVVRALDIEGIVPVKEIGPGIVLSQSLDRQYTFLSKSGGFGSEQVLLEMDRLIQSGGHGCVGSSQAGGIHESAAAPDRDGSTG